MSPPLNRTALVQRIAAARRDKNLSIRKAASLAGVPPSTAQGWFDGRHLPTPALMPHFLKLIEALGLADTSADTAAWRRAINLMRSTTVVQESPYVGLRSYGVDDSEVYLGRERALQTLVEACSADDASIIFVVGASGSGKSSLLAAGLIGQAGGPKGPLAHLESRLITAADLSSFEATDEETLLVIDQFEEAEQLEPDVRAAAFDTLVSLPSHIIRVVAITADSFGFAMRDERLAPFLSTPVLLGPLNEEEYTKIIVEPARIHGRDVSPSLIHLALQELRLYGEPEPGTALPLLSSAMRRCWLASEGTVLTAEDYLRAGGLWSALDAEAEAVYTHLDDQGRELARRLLLSMVHVHGEHVLRRRIEASGLSPQMSALASGFLNSRLLSQSEGELVISHDALLTRWHRLSDWIDEARASLVIARRIHMAAQLWDEGGRNAEALLPVEAELWKSWAASDEAPLLSDMENDFITQSISLAESQHREQQTQIRKLGRRQAAAIAAAALAIVMMLTALLAGHRSETYRAEAEAATRMAQARQVALIADEVRPMAPNIAAQLSVAAMEIDASVQTKSAVLKSAGNPLPTRVTGPTGNTMLVYHPTSDTIIRADSAGTIAVWPGADLTAAPIEVDSGGEQLFAIRATTIEGRALVFVGGQRTAGVWELAEEPRKLGEFGEDTVTYSAAWSGDTLLFGTLEGEIRRVDFSSVDEPTPLPALELGESMAVTGLAANPEWILAGGLRSRLELFDSEGQHHETLAIDGTALAIDTSPDQTEFLVGSAMSTATRWRTTETGLELLSSIEVPGLVHAVKHLGDRILLAGSIGHIHEYNTQWELLASYPERTIVTSVDAMEGAIIAGSTGGKTTLWDPTQPNTVLQAPDGVSLHGITSGEDLILVGSSAGARIMRLAENQWGELSTAPPPADSSYTYYYAMSSTGAVLVNQTTEGDLITMHRDNDAYHQVHSMAGHETLTDIRISPTGRFLALGYRGQAGYHLHEWVDDGWHPVVVIESWPGGSAFSRDDALFVAMHVDGSGIVVWDLTGPTPKLTSSFEMPDSVTPVAFSFGPGKTLAVGDNRGEVSLYSLADPTSPELFHQLTEARSSISQVNYSPDGTKLLASTREGQLWVWTVADGDIRLDLQLEPGATAIQGAAFFEGWLVMTLSDGRTVAWPDDPAAAVQDLCSRFGTPISADEWERHVTGVAFTSGCPD